MKRGAARKLWLVPLLAAAIGCSDDAAQSAARDSGAAPPEREAGAAPEASPSEDAAPDATGEPGGPLTYTGAFTMGSGVPPRHQCLMPIGGGEGENVSPLLEWAGGPAGTRSFALVLFDATFGVLHWVVWDIPGTATALPEGIPPGRDLSDPAGAHQTGAFMTEGQPAYFGPCSSAAIGATYEYRLYALDVELLPVGDEATAADVQAAIEVAAIDSVVWAGSPE